MIFCVNAWLERPDPFISVLNQNSGLEVMRFEKECLDNYLQAGDFCLEDFCSADIQQQQALVRDLLLLRCCKVMKMELDLLVSEFTPYGESNVVQFPGSYYDSVLDMGGAGER